MRKKIVIMAGGILAGKHILQQAISKQLLDQGVDLVHISHDETHSADFKAHVCCSDKVVPYNNDCLVLKNPPKDLEFIVPEGISHLKIVQSEFPKVHFAEVKARINRQSETIRKQITEVPKVHKKTNRTPKKKKRK